MNRYLVKCVDFGWTETIETPKKKNIGDLVILNGCICAVVKIIKEN